MVKRIFTFLFILVLTAGLFSAKYNYLLATDAPAGSLWVKFIEEINGKLQKKYNGEVDIKVYAGGTMRDQSSVIKKIKIGQLSGAGLSSGGAQLIYKDFGVLGFPTLFRSYDEYDYIVSTMGDFFENEFEKNGFVLLGWTEVGFIYVFSKKPVATMEDLKNGKPYLMEGDIISEALYKEAGIKPVQTKMSDILTDLNTGRVETVFNSTYGLLATQWFSKISYMADFPITFMIGAIVVDKELFYSMPKEYQDTMRNLFNEYMAKLAKKVRQDNESAKDALVKKAGIKVLPVKDDQKKIFYDSCERASTQLTKGEFSEELYIKIKTALEEYRKKR
ncbi:MAG: TRAP transporter substrate-binding protein DctP [Spirochaetes bacterium]|nr:TRAP transporter substrate-binding protein DctP [Spirochaetota bacterium]